MNAYFDVENDNTKTLLTTGVRDCVVLILYNPNYGRYLAHYLKYNDFFEALSNACESIDINDSDCKIKETERMESCDMDSKKIHLSLPKWTTDDDTVISIFNLIDIYTIVSRFNQLIRQITLKCNVHIHLYINNASKMGANFYKIQYENSKEE